MSARILFVVGQLRAGGLERQLCYLLESLSRRSCGACVVVWNFREDDFYVGRLRQMGVVLHAFHWTHAWQKMRALRQLVREIRPEVVHSFSYYTNYAAWYAARGTGALSVGSLRSDFVTEKKLAGPVLGRLSARWPRETVANNQAAARAAERGGFFTPRKVHVVRNGLDLSAFHPSASFPELPTLISVGTLSPDKRWDRVLRGCAEMRREGRRFRLRLVGDGPLYEPLRRQAHELGIAEVVEFLGQRSDVPRLLSSAAFLVHTADREGCPNVVMEAMASGRAVLSTDAGDIPDLVTNGVSGFVVRRGEDEALFSRMATLIDQRELWVSMGQAGRRHAESEFTLDRMTDEMLEAYRRAGWEAGATA